MVLVATEFGRTARVNGTGGTDHGTGSTALMLGGALKPGGIVGDWPTLKQSALFENRDVAPTLDMRGLFKGVLAEHMGVDRARAGHHRLPGQRRGEAGAGPGLARYFGTASKAIVMRASSVVNGTVPCHM